jgi:hypothetical protein
VTLLPLFSSGEAKGKKVYCQKWRNRIPVVILMQLCAMDALKEYLEEIYDLKRKATIQFRAVDGGLSTVQGHVVKMDKVAGREIIETDAGMVIGTDQIVEINGRRFSSNC